MITKALRGVTNLPGMSLHSWEKRGQIHTIPCNFISVYAANSLKSHTYHDAITRTVLENRRKHDPEINYTPNNQALSKESSYVDLCPMLDINE
jgi:hypothetical protein